MTIAMVSHPFGPRQMAIKRMPCAFRFTTGVDMQDDPSDLTPIDTFGVSVEQPQVGHQMLLIIVARQRLICRRGVATSGSSGGCFMKFLIKYS
jgi:hypothetical protein